MLCENIQKHLELGDMPDTCPNKRRRGKERVRVTRACDICKRKKLRCSGTLPCSLCVRSTEKCEYNAGYRRGRIPQIPVIDQDATIGLQSPTITPGRAALEKNVDQVPGKIKKMQAGSSPPEQISVQLDMQLIRGHETELSTGLTESVSPDVSSYLPQSHYLQASTDTPVLPRKADSPRATTSSRTSPEPDETDLEGHYVGASSGVSFLLRVQKRLHENFRISATETIFNFGDAPLPTCDPHFLVLPPLREANVLVERYFDFSFPTHRFLHQRTVEAWLQDFYSGVNETSNFVDRAVKAVILMVLAQGKQYLAENDGLVGESVKSNVYFAASENHLLSEKGAIKLTSIQARLAQCFYLLSESRINHCWSLFGTTARLALAIGLNRRRRHEMITDYVEEECRKRVFWCAYSLDNLLSAALGRPRIFHDEDIDQEYPVCANDSQILRHAILPPESQRQSIMLASIFHAKLSKILSGILRDLYGIQRKPLDVQVEIARKYGVDLIQWRRDIGAFIDTPNIELLQVTYQRQYTVLNFAFAHTQILLYRPFVLRNLASVGKGTAQDNSHLRTLSEENIKKCLQAATRILEIFQILCRTRRMYKSFFFTHYYVFSAIVVLYVSVIQNWMNLDFEPKHNLRIGEEAQRELAKCGTQASFPQRYVVVLEELRQEAKRIMNQTRGRQVPSIGTLNMHEQLSEPSFTPSSEQFNQVGTTFTAPLYHSSTGGWVNKAVEDTTPGSHFADVTGWGDFDSLVLTGLGELGHLFSDNHLGAERE